MLILTRRISETLCIGDNIKVTVLGVKGNQVRIGIEAPKTVAVHREEIYEKVQVERAARAPLATFGDVAGVVRPGALVAAHAYGEDTQ